MSELNDRNNAVVYRSEGLNDYAMPAMKAEKALKDIHFGVIDQEPEKAKAGAKELLKRALELRDWVEEWDAQRQK